MPVMRERFLTRPAHFAPDSRGADATQGAGFKRAADARLPGSASRAKARRLKGQDDIGQALAPPQAVSGLLTLPDDILLTHLPPWLGAYLSLFEALHENQALTDLKLNGITTVAIPALLELLQHNTTQRCVRWM
jgi:hypothetical protein